MFDDKRTEIISRLKPKVKHETRNVGYKRFPQTDSHLEILQLIERGVALISHFIIINQISIQRFVERFLSGNVYMT